MSGTWYVQVMGEELGPLSDDALREMVFKRQLMPDNLVRRGLSGSWVPASRVRGLFQNADEVSSLIATTSSSELQKPLIHSPAARHQATRDESTAATNRRTQLIACPDCGKRISPNANSCPNCGHDFFRPNRSVAIALAWILGGIGVHKFYLRKPGDGIAYLLFCWTFIPAIFALVEGFRYLSMDDDTFASTFGAVPNAKVASRTRKMPVNATSEQPKRRWIGWAVAGFVVLTIIGAMSNSDADRVDRSNGSAVTNWYSGGTLRDKSALDWQVAPYDDKLATCAEMVASLHINNMLKPHVDAQVQSSEGLKRYAIELVAFLDAATEKHADEEMNRKMYSNQTARELSAIGVQMMGWVK